MAVIYLSPSTQEKNLYVSGGTEEYYMNQIADAMEPYLLSGGILFVRNSPLMTAGSSIRQSNTAAYDLHLALHSNAAPEGRYGEVRGSEVYYSPDSRSGRRAASVIAENLRKIYPGTVRTVPTTRLGEVQLTRAPAALIEFAYHDNKQDAAWIIENINEIAVSVVQALTEYFQLPFLQPEPVRTGIVRTDGGPLNLRARPGYSAPVAGQMPNGRRVIIYGQTENWYVVQDGGRIGYAAAQYITL